MKFFIDTADVSEIRHFHTLGMVDGVTTNPTLVAKTGRNFRQVIQEIGSFVDGPVSAEAISEDAEGMVKEALEYSKWGKNIAIKIPMTEEGLKATKILSKRGVKTNVTLVFSANQALMAAKAGATFVSPFIGRLDDIGHDGMQVIRDIMQIYENYGFKTEVIVASIRHPMHVVEAARIGAHIATIPPGVMHKMAKHALTDVGLKRFLEDYKKIPRK
jgi:transaldolase